MPVIHHKSAGKGQPILLIHGFPMHMGVWNDFAHQVANNFHVFTIDLPGFGKSDLPATTFSLETIADIVIKWLKEKDIVPVIVGHSLGGYVALSIAAKAPDVIRSLVLLHSTALADSEEKKQNRNKVMDFVKSNGVKAFTSNFITPLFADPEHPKISSVREITMEASEEVVLGYTLAMRDRRDTTQFLKTTSKRVLLIGGSRDSGIPLSSLEAQAQLSPNVELHVLKNSAHMGMFEEPAETLSVVRDFASRK